MMRPVPAVVLCATLAGTVFVGGTAIASERSEALRRQAFHEVYSLNHDAAVATARLAIEAAPEDPGAHRALAAILWLNLLFQRGNITADDYIGSMTSPNLKLQAPPAAFAAEFHASIDRALALAEGEVRLRPGDASAHYDVGAAVGRMAAYTASIDGKVLGSLGAARRAFDEHERVLALDPSRVEAGLVLGTYRYLVANLSLVKRWMAYAVGFGGDKERAIRLLEACAMRPSDVQTEARFVLIVVHTRERRYNEALKVLQVLRAAYPTNRLLWLESGATELRAGRAAAAAAYLDTGLAMFGSDDRRKALGEAALWHYKRGAARVLLDDRAGAAADLQAALDAPGRDWVHGRTHTELGKIAAAAGDRAAARQHWTKAAELGRRDNDGAGAVDAERLLSPSMHKYGDVFVPSGLSAERAQPATSAEHRSWPELRVEVLSRLGTQAPAR